MNSIRMLIFLLGPYRNHTGITVPELPDFEGGTMNSRYFPRK